MNSKMLAIPQEERKKAWKEYGDKFIFATLPARHRATERCREKPCKRCFQYVRECLRYKREVTLLKERLDATMRSHITHVCGCYAGNCPTGREITTELLEDCRKCQEEKMVTEIGSYGDQIQYKDIGHFIWYEARLMELWKARRCVKPGCANCRIFYIPPNKDKHRPMREREERCIPGKTTLGEFYEGIRKYNTCNDCIERKEEETHHHRAGELYTRHKGERLTPVSRTFINLWSLCRIPDDTNAWYKPIYRILLSERVQIPRHYRFLEHDGGVLTTNRFLQKSLGDKYTFLKTEDQYRPVDDTLKAQKEAPETHLSPTATTEEEDSCGEDYEPFNMSPIPMSD